MDDEKLTGWRFGAFWLMAAGLGVLSWYGVFKLVVAVLS